MYQYQPHSLCDWSTFYRSIEEWEKFWNGTASTNFMATLDCKLYSLNLRSWSECTNYEWPGEALDSTSFEKENSWCVRSPCTLPQLFLQCFSLACMHNQSLLLKKTQKIHYLGFIEKFWGVKCEGGIFGRTGHSLEEPIVLLRTTKVTTIHPTVGRLRINIYT